jgi:drug/metabolite transporter (DMT)-like permease
MTQDIKFKENTLGLLSICMWALFPIIILGFNGAPPLLTAGLSFLIAAFLGMSFYRCTGHTFQSMCQANLRAYTLVIGAYSAYIGCLLFAFSLIPAFEATILNYLWPIGLLLLSSITKKRLTVIALISTLIGFVGVLFMYIDNIQGGDGLVGEVWGYVCALMAALVWATYSTCTRFVSFNNKNLPIFMLFSAIAFLSAYYITADEIYILTAQEWLFIGLFGLTRLSFMFWDYAMKYGDIDMLAPLAYLTPLLATGGLILFGHSPVTLFDWLGGGLILSASLISQIKPRKK